MKNLLIYILTALLIYFVISNYITSEQVELFKNVSLYQILISVLIALTIFTVSGNQFSCILNKTSKTKLSIADRTGFPIARNLWSYIIPFQGSLAYSLAFAKFKYKIALNESLSLNIYLLLFNFFFTGNVGIFYSFQADSLPVAFLLISVLFFLIPFIVLITKKIIGNIEFSRNNFFYRVIKNTKLISTNITILLKDIKFSIIIFTYNILHTIITTIWFYWTVNIFNLDISLLSVIFLALLLKISQTFRLTPGNLGVEQLIYGGIFALMSYDPKTGVMISLFHKSVTILISLTLGSFFTFVNLKYFKFNTI